MIDNALWGSQRELALNSRPFLRWAGGKQRWLTSNSNKLPRFDGQYFEPFLGGGSIFFHLVRRESRPFSAWLGDTNRQLTRAYLDIKNDTETVIEGIETIKAAYKAATDKRQFYERVRESFNQALPKSYTPSFIFLNSTCWNGLWRTNAKGWFNVPFGLPKSDDVFPTPDEIRAVGAALSHSRIRASSWQNIVSAAGKGDFVFLDPPYFSDSLQKGSPKYGTEHWGFDRHAELADMLVLMQDRGVLFVLTNSSEEEMIGLYQSRGLQISHVMVPRAINSRTDERQPVGEVIVSNAIAEDDRHWDAGVLLDLEMLRKSRQRPR
jgi:DNA adenine methylase